MKVLLFCTGHNSQIHNISCPICDCDDMCTYSVMSWLPVSCISGRGPMKPLPPSLSLSKMARKQINWMFLNPLHPIISMYILQTVSKLFPILYKMLTRRICLTIFGWWSFPFFLWPRCLIQGWHCKVQYSSEVLGPKCMWKVHFKKCTKACNFSKYTTKNMCKKKLIGMYNSQKV